MGRVSAKGRPIFFFFNFYWCRVALQCCVSTIQQSESVICIHIFLPPLFGFPFHLGHHRALNRVPCAIQQVLINYLYYTQYQQYIYVNPNLLFNPPLFPPWCPQVCSLHPCLYFCRQVHLYPFARFHIYVLIHNICFSLSDFTLNDSLWVHPCLCKWHNFVSFYG